jgi:hypothetical protein
MQPYPAPSAQALGYEAHDAVKSVHLRALKACGQPRLAVYAEAERSLVMRHGQFSLTKPTSWVLANAPFVRKVSTDVPQHPLLNDEGEVLAFRLFTTCAQPPDRGHHVVELAFARSAVKSAALLNGLDSRAGPHHQAVGTIT